MQALREIGYEGWATAEVGGGNKARLSDIAQRMDRLLAS
jgi:hexulose-6-phosphate isomerase